MKTKSRRRLPKVGLGGLDGKDVEFVRTVRNENREAFFNSHEVSRAGQREWWHWYNSDDCDLVMFCIYWRRNKVGTISVEDYPDRSVIGNVALLDKYKGKGIMRAAVAKLTKQGGRYEAVTKMDNIRSIKLFLDSGFQIDPSKSVDGKIVLVADIPVPKVVRS
jgi:RimJ/RimL family protein N-acetyltransferase